MCVPFILYLVPFILTGSPCFRVPCAGSGRKWDFHTHTTSRARGGEGVEDRALNSITEPCRGSRPFSIERWARQGGRGRVKDFLKNQNVPVDPQLEVRPRVTALRTLLGHLRHGVTSCHFSWKLVAVPLFLIRSLPVAARITARGMGASGTSTPYNSTGARWGRGGRANETLIPSGPARQRSFSLERWARSGGPGQGERLPLKAEWPRFALICRHRFPARDVAAGHVPPHTSWAPSLRRHVVALISETSGCPAFPRSSAGIPPCRPCWHRSTAATRRRG